jgi:mono/diheme cytochrome c family protein
MRLFKSALLPFAAKLRFSDNLFPAGAQLFGEHCASCHEETAEGLGRRPSLQTQRVHDASHGELQWLLRSGSLARGCRVIEFA